MAAYTPGISDDISTFVMHETDRFPSLQAPFEPRVSHVGSSLITSGFTPAQNWSSFPPCHAFSQATNRLQVQRLSPTRPSLPTQTQVPPVPAAALNAFNSSTTYTITCENEAGTSNITQNNLQSNYLARYQQQPSRSLLRKRAPKAQTMSAKSWRPCEGRLKQLYVHDGKSIKELREILNREFGFTATERQYKAQIKKMDLERNVKEEEQKAIVRSILHRTYVEGKNSSHVRVRGHKMALEKISRWMKDVVTDQPSMDAVPISPLPSCISVYTNSPCGSPKLLSTALSEYQAQGLLSMSPKDMEITIMQRFLKYARLPKHTVESKEARAIFNYLQLILSCSPEIRRESHDAWNSNVAEDLVGIRNLINMTQEIVVNENGVARQSSSAIPEQNLQSYPPRGFHRHAAWMTPYGRVETAFWTISSHSGGIFFPEATITTRHRGFAARVALIPADPTAHSFRVVFDFTSHFNISANISYQAMIPNDSEVFKIVSSGQIKRLIEAVEQGTASLTDRDQEGRSLLNYAVFNIQAEMCKFLVEMKADVNAIEPEFDPEFIGPVHGLFPYNYCEVEETQRLKTAECLKIMLEAGADISLETHRGCGQWTNSFMDAVHEGSFAAFKHALDFGEPFISPNGTYKSWHNIQCTPLTFLAIACGYNVSDTMDVLDKAILLLKRGADISCRDGNGDTVLHTLLKSERWHERVSKTEPCKFCFVIEQLRRSMKEPPELLKAFISAGADVYATNNEGQTPTALAWIYGRDEEWTEALDFCGYDLEQVFAHEDRGLHQCSCERQISKLSFQEFCQKREENVELEEIDTRDEGEDEDEDEDESEGEDEDEDNSDDERNGEAEDNASGIARMSIISSDIQQCHERIMFLSREAERFDGTPKSPCGVERIDSSMNLGLEDTGHHCKDDFVGQIDHMVEHDQTIQGCFESMGLDFESSIEKEKNFMGDFFDFDSFTNVFL
ncbi:uncharacterized protein PAC_13051 [Phialocephala subalpina]|uniref:Clr5 domain-containing protein n=1 Tax=Phialocephala subalpina TaxID=576137 RepID=A0A1L7XDQ1_9HELO|nr:uncharacterized protein PAC_13051 [Phialocephala subalpina]